MKIAYEPHPVSPERKAELRAAGFKIVDARFKTAEPIAQADEVHEDVPTEKPKRTYKRKAKESSE